MDTVGTKKLLEIKEHTCNDSWQLFSNLQQYNPYTPDMRKKFTQALEEVVNKLEI
jgi:prephenate dehydrogenase